MGKLLKEPLEKLEAWFERQKRVLPWRDEPSLYRVWISEIMLQQTQVATVVPYFERFLARFPSVEALARASEDDVLLHWAGLGYYSRARNLHRAARMIIDQGGFPKTLEGWLELPGVGNYTAGAILSIALDEPEPILDGNVERVMSRLRCTSRARGDSEFKARLWGLSRIFVERAHAFGIRPSVLNQALMELGATLCTPKKPKCLLCPLSESCRARQAGDAEAYPPKKKPKKWIKIREELHGIFDSEGRLRVEQRRAGQWRAGLWDLSVDPPEGAELLGEVETRHVVTRHQVTRITRVWKLKGWSAAEPTPSDSCRWIAPGRPELPVGSALKQTLQKIRERFPEVLPED